MLEVDRTGGPHDGNVYFCWSRFLGNAGRTKIFFSRSTDHGATFSRASAISGDLSVQGCDIASSTTATSTSRGDSARSAEAGQPSGMSVVRSTDGGASFGATRQIARFTPYSPFVGGPRLRRRPVLLRRPRLRVLPGPAGAAVDC